MKKLIHFSGFILTLGLFIALGFFVRYLQGRK